MGCGDILKLADAKKSIVKEQIEDYHIVMLSTHAMGNIANDNPIPWIALYDEQLLLPELYALNLSAKLFIFNACQSSRGTSKSGEGTMSIVRGIAYAGCPSIFSTLWTVDEENNIKIVESYIYFLEDGYTKDEALYQAKINYLENNDESHPHFWTGVVQIGDLTPIFEDESWGDWLSRKLLCKSVGNE